MNGNNNNSVDLTTTYMGLTLKNPLVVSASPLSNSLETVSHLEEAGVSAIVLFSLFEEQIIHESFELNYHLSYGTETYAEALSFYPDSVKYVLTPHKYLEHISKMKKEVNIPVIGSLNGFTPGGWTKYAKYIEEAGADALELNIYFIPADFSRTSSEVENIYIDIFRSVKSAVSIPVAVKLSPYFSAMANMAKRFEDAGADALVLFNRFYQPDIDLEELEIQTNILLSTPQAMRLPLHWIAILYGHLRCSLGATSGIHTAEDILKMVMAGADVTMMCSALLKNGTDYAADVLSEVETWMKQHEYKSIQQMKGSMSQKSCSNPEIFQRANYIKSLKSYIYTQQGHKM